MPDVSRSNSQRSDSSRPRVSFNRDVHVKRISSPGAPRVVGALASDGEGHLVHLPVRRERTNHLSRRELAKEAERVLAQADSINCTSLSLSDQSQKSNKHTLNSNKKFSTLPPLRQKNKKNHHNKTNQSIGEDSPSSSPDRHINKLKQSNKKSPTGYADIETQDIKPNKRGIVASVFSTLDPSKKHNYIQEDNESESLKKSKKNSSSLNDLLGNNSPSFSGRSKKKRVDLKRSVSDVGTRKSIKNNIKIKKSSGFLSLDRLTSRRNKNKNKTLVIHSDHSDRSPPRPRKNILKKSYSDSESAPQNSSQEQNPNFQGENRKKKQLSPIIEAHPREDYFHEQNATQVTSSSKKTETSDKEDTMIHSSQLPAQKPTLTRGQTVDAMVKRLSHDFSRSKGPPRVVNSAPGLITPEHRQHNNNLPFSYTKPTTHSVEPTHDSLLTGGPAGSTSAPTAVDGQVIYAEVVVSGGGGAVSKQTVHTKVLPVSQMQQEEPIQPKFHTRHVEETRFQEIPKVFPSGGTSQHKVTVKVAEPHPHYSDEDEGLDLTMEHGGYKNSSLDYLNDDRRYNRKGNYNGGNSYINKSSFMETRTRIDDNDRSTFQNFKREERTDYSGNNTRREYSVHESKYDSENHFSDPSARGRGDGMDSKRKDFLSSENYNVGRYDNILYPSHTNNISPKIRKNHVGDYSRKENYKSEFLSDARIIPPDEVDGQRHFGRDSKEVLFHSVDGNDLSSRRDRLESRIESQRKERFISNKYSDTGNYKKHPLDIKNEINGKYTTDIAFNNRRDFLNSQLDYDKNSVKQEEIRHENDKNYGLKSRRYFESSTTEIDNFGKKDLFADSGIEIDYRTKDSMTNGRKYNKSSQPDSKISLNQHTQNVSRVELRNSSNDHNSDEDDSRNHNFHNLSDVSQHHKTKTTNTFTSTRLIQEQKSTEAIPSSTVLIRHWVPSNNEESTPLKNKKTQTFNTKPDKIHQPLLSDEEYEEYEKSRRKDEHRKEIIEDTKKNEDKLKKSEEKTKKSSDKKEIKKKPTSAMDKMRQLFTRNEKSQRKSKRKDEKVKTIVETVEEEDEEEDPLTARYTEYKGSNVDLSQESPRPTYRDRSHGRGGNIDTEEETPRQVLKNRRLLEPETSRERRHLHGSNMEINQDTSNQKGSVSPKSSHRSRSHHTRVSSSNLDEGTPRASRREGSKGKQYNRISDLDEHRDSEKYHQPIRERLPTPSPSPSPPRTHNRSTSATLTRINNMKNNSNGSGGGWFKSLDRLTKRGKNKAKENDTDVTTEDEMRTIKNYNNNSSSSNKNLRFFGDTDLESVSSVIQQSNHPTLRRYKSNNNSTTSSSNRLQVPSRNMGGGLRHHRSTGDVATSSAESTTEGDSSQQSQRSVVYLHAATVGDIPGPARSQHSGVARRAQSREELSSTAGSSRPLQPQTRTVSRSISVLAPWKPRHYREGLEVHYDNNESNGSKTLRKNKDGKPPKVPSSHNGNTTMNRRGRYRSNVEQGKENNSIDKQRVNKAVSVESLSHKNGSGQRQYARDLTPTEKKRSALNSSASVESLSHKQNRDKSTSSKKYSALNSSAMELNSNKSYRTATKKGNEASTRKSSAKVSRSASMPKDSRLTAGWFKLRNKKQGT